MDLKTIAIVGEDNPLSSHADDALVPYPRGCAGHRLLGILGISEDDYMAIDRRNLCSPVWNLKAAREAATAILYAGKHVAVIALGVKVAGAFRVSPFIHSELSAFNVAYSTANPQDPTTVVALPHPSGRNTIWNSPAVRKRAIDILSEQIPGVPWGSVAHR